MLIALSSDHHHHNYSAFAKTLSGGMNSRVAEMLAVEAYMREVMKERGVKLHLRGGDLFDRKNQIDAVVFAELSGQIAANRDAGIEEVITKGNHDLAAGGVRNSLEALTHIGNVQVIADYGQFTVGGLFIGIVPYDDDPARQKALIEQIADTARQHDGPRLLLSHLQIRGAKSGSEYVLPGSLGTDDLRLDVWNLVLLGHIHEPQQLTPKAHYIGSMCQRAFTDEGVQRRMLLLDTETCTFEEVPLPGPRFYTVEIDDPEELCELESTVRQSDYYKFVLKTSIKVKDIDEIFDGRLAGWIVTHNLAGPAAAPRIDPRLTHWEDIFAQYVAQASTDLDKTRLLQISNELRTETVDATP